MWICLNYYGWYFLFIYVVSKDQNQDPKRSKIVIESDECGKDRSIKSKSNERDKERIRELEREREYLEREKRKQKEILNLTKIKVRYFSF